ncbi:hypothetical protein C9J12_15340 [Photobacterium frigidiphilum]|uniref:Uncharacterized protein n=1 Tax=Photobacterium frigidiphilum TaxID=264736 RepID=A0A2T3JEP4_9GAMM|nr:hypothetical protein [Photobacterium frigidiphilum]PSU47369.1 hypothetical protein C9J12_15340 [Photobacterium frigidiphilum]
MFGEDRQIVEVIESINKLQQVVISGVAVYAAKELYQFVKTYYCDKRSHKEAFIDFIVELTYVKESVELMTSNETIGKILEIGKSKYPRCVVSVVLNISIYQNMMNHRHKFGHDQLILLTKITEKTEQFYNYYKLLGTDMFGELPTERKKQTVKVFKNLGGDLLVLVKELYMDEKFLEKAKCDGVEEQFNKLKPLPFILDDYC